MKTTEISFERALRCKFKDVVLISKYRLKSNKHKRMADIINNREPVSFNRIYGLIQKSLDGVKFIDFWHNTKIYLIEY